MHHNQTRGVIVSADAASQPLLSTAVAELFKKKFPLEPPGEDPEWFVKMKESAGRSMQQFMTVHGPWDMCVKMFARVSGYF